MEELLFKHYDSLLGEEKAKEARAMGNTEEARGWLASAIILNVEATDIHESEHGDPKRPEKLLSAAKLLYDIKEWRHAERLAAEGISLNADRDTLVSLRSLMLACQIMLGD
ncbi:MAG: hypothetical protein ACK5QX_02455 [bacterium]|jgi:hypothetical protein